MIASLYGNIKSLRLDRVVIEVNGIGYLVQISIKTANQMAIGREAQLFTSMVVREDSMTLYGFLSESERELFELVQTVSGFGPKVALAITQAMDIDDLASAIATKDEVAIAAIPGIGKKSAQRLILELSGKLELSHPTTKTGEVSWRTELIEALVGLGFNRRQAENAINEMSSEISVAELAELSPSERLKLALSKANTSKGLKA
ncbi:MAG: Holliday junction branch migration protein RuvA [Candidatus Nanopelagicaceae bacterium]|jgi:Holliday junction DNA helicase RuvA